MSTLLTRRVFPYVVDDRTPFTPFTDGVQAARVNGARLPMDVPDLAFRNHYNTPSETRRGEVDNTKGSLEVVVTIEPVYNSGPDTARGASRNTHMGVVKTPQIPNTIRKPFIVSRNLFSPTAHRDDASRCALSAVIPPPATRPSKDIRMPEKMGKRGSGGHFT